MEYCYDLHGNLVTTSEDVGQLPHFADSMVTTYFNALDPGWDKLDPRSIRCIFLGYSPHSERVEVSLSLRRHFVCVDVMFNETLPFYKGSRTPVDLHEAELFHTTTPSVPPLKSLQPCRCMFLDQKYHQNHQCLPPRLLHLKIQNSFYYSLYRYSYMHLSSHFSLCLC